MEGVVKSWRKLQAWDSVYSADSIEFCPLAPYQHVFLCGTYQLNETQDSDTSKEVIFEISKLFYLLRSKHTYCLIDMLENGQKKVWLELQKIGLIEWNVTAEV